MSGPPAAIDPPIGTRSGVTRPRRLRPLRWLRSEADVRDRAVVAVALAAVSGAWVAHPAPVWPPAALALLAFVLRRPLLLAVVVGVLASGLAAQAWQGVRPVASGPFSGRATLLTDPERLGGAVHVEVRAVGHHFDVWARGRAGAALADRAAGQSIEIDGRVAPRRPGDDRAARRHLVGRIEARQVRAAGDGGPAIRLANGARALLVHGVAALPVERRSLFAGFVLGDDRGQSVAVVDDFRGSGLSHLLVVSGENLAFVLAVALPLLRRLGLRWRWLTTMAILGFFALMTRFEPSVLRASAMAAIAVTAWVVGRPASGLRVLALAVTALVLVDPMLVGVMGFQLSVAASAGILLLARPLAEHLPLPRWLAAPLGVTLAAQAGVGPLLVGQAGGLPVAGIPANLLAEPAAAAIMAWGLTAGAVAGLVGGRFAQVLHWPTNALLWWVESVARRGAAVPLGQVGRAQLALAAVAGLGAVLAARSVRRGWAALGWVALVLVLIAPAIGADRARPLRTELARVGTLWQTAAPRSSVLVLAIGARPADVLGALRRAGVGRVDLVVAPARGSSTTALVTVVRGRVPIERVWLPPPSTISGAAAGSTDEAGVEPMSLAGEEHPGLGDELVVGRLAIDVTGIDPTLEVEVRSRVDRRRDPD